MTRTELRALLARAKMSQREAAELCGVTTRTIKNWLSGASPVPILAENALIAEEAARDCAAFERDTQTPTDAAQLLGVITAEQRRRIAALERDLAEEKAALAETERRLKAL